MYPEVVKAFFNRQPYADEKYIVVPYYDVSYIVDKSELFQRIDDYEYIRRYRIVRGEPIHSVAKLSVDGLGRYIVTLKPYKHEATEKLASLYQYILDYIATRFEPGIKPRVELTDCIEIYLGGELPWVTDPKVRTIYRGKKVIIRGYLTRLCRPNDMCKDIYRLIEDFLVIEKDIHEAVKELDPETIKALLNEFYKTTGLEPAITLFTLLYRLECNVVRYGNEIAIGSRTPRQIAKCLEKNIKYVMILHQMFKRAYLASKLLK